MEVTEQELLHEASMMALELRLKDRRLAALEQENAQLRARLEPPADADAGHDAQP